MKKILITGGLGYIGTEIIKLLNFKNIICILDKKTYIKTKQFLKKGVKFIDLIFQKYLSK